MENVNSKETLKGLVQIQWQEMNVNPLELPEPLHKLVTTIDKHSLLKLITHKQNIRFHVLLNTPCKHSQYRVEKVCEPLVLITA